MKNLILNASRKGYVSTGVWSLVWLVLLGCLMAVFVHLAQEKATTILRLAEDQAKSLALCMEDVQKYGVSWADFGGLCPHGVADAEAELVYYLYCAGACLVGLVMGLVVWENIAVLYRLREINTFVEGRAGVWQKFVSTWYEFPASVFTEETIIDRILAVEVQQTMIDRWCGVGTLIVTAAAFVNTETNEYEFTIPGVLNPSAAREAIMAQAGEHHGLDVRMAAKN
jgi:hypothetical protein